MDNRDIAESSAGWNGLEFISDTATHTAPKGQVYTALQVISDAVFSTLNAESSSMIAGNSVLGVTISAGTTVYGRFTSVALSSGSLIAYKGV